MKRTLLIAVFIPGVLALASCRKPSTVPPVPPGVQTMTGVLIPADLGLLKRGTHILRSDGEDLALVESATVNLRPFDPALTPGRYILFAKADAPNDVRERREDNNLLDFRTHIRVLRRTDFPDLTVIDIRIDPPGPKRAGEAFRIIDTTRNVGTLDTESQTTTRYYLSLDRVADSGDAILGERRVPILVAGTSNTDFGGTALTIPAGTPPGRYALLAVADANNEVPDERNELNNTLFKNLDIR